MFPGENIGLGVAALDELGVATGALFTLSDDSLVSSNGSQDKVSDSLLHQYPQHYCSLFFRMESFIVLLLPH